jgi:hypothetical protein
LPRLSQSCANRDGGQHVTGRSRVLSHDPISQALVRCSRKPQS